MWGKVNSSSETGGWLWESTCSSLISDKLDTCGRRALAHVPPFILHALIAGYKNDMINNETGYSWSSPNPRSSPCELSRNGNIYIILQTSSDSIDSSTHTHSRVEKFRLSQKISGSVSEWKCGTGPVPNGSRRMFELELNDCDCV